MTNEQLIKAKECKSAEELFTLAKENNIEMTAEEAAEKFAQLHNEGELSDNELETAAGGACHKKDGRMVVTAFHSCEHYLCEKCGLPAPEGGQSIYQAGRCKCGATGGGKGSIGGAACKSCKFCSYEKAMWLCNNEENMK